MLNLPMDHIGLHCSDVELNAKWYQEELGFKVAGKFPGMGGRNVYFLENPQDGKMYEISQRDQLPGGTTTRICPAISTTLVSKPPGLSLRSMINFFAPCFLRLFSPLRNWLTEVD